jgi:hypothetical protein
MTTERNGGAAFPTPEIRDANGNGIVQGGCGMSLRDWFAGKALAPAWAMFSHPDAYSKTGETLTVNDLAATAYEIADAMLAERSRT